MPRFFTSAVQFDEAASVGSAVIDGEDGRHIARSLRMHTGDALTLSDGAGTDYTGEIESITGDTALQIHVVEDLVFHVALRDRLGLLQNTVGKRAFAVVNMCNDAEIANFTLFQA